MIKRRPARHKKEILPSIQKVKFKIINGTLTLSFYLKAEYDLSDSDFNVLYTVQKCNLDYLCRIFAQPILIIVRI